MTSALSFLHFIHKLGGVEELYLLVEDLNKPRVRQCDVAERYKIDEGYLSRVLKDCFEWRLIPKPETQMLIDTQLHLVEDHHAEQSRIRSRILSFTSGRESHPAQGR
jgi:hypothetical protein